VRLLRIDIESFRSIEDEWLPAAGLVVLFGANSAGKTSVLEAAEQLMSQAGTLRSDQPQQDRPDNVAPGTAAARPARPATTEYVPNASARTCWA
jgi:predicted ATP-dependent endonuclease of OLD family